MGGLLEEKERERERLLSKVVVVGGARTACCRSLGPQYLQSAGFLVSPMFSHIAKSFSGRAYSWDHAYKQ